MRLYGTPLFHFTRKVRVVLQELKIPYQFMILDKILETGKGKFAHNPLHMFPVFKIRERRFLGGAGLRGFFELVSICSHPNRFAQRHKKFVSFNGTHLTLEGAST